MELAPVTWEPLGPENAKEIWALIDEIESTDEPAYRTAYSEVRSYFDPAFAWSASGARTPSGELAAFGLTRMPSRISDEVELVVSGGVHPLYRGQGLGRYMVTAQMEAAREMVKDFHVPASACMHVDSNRVDLRELLEALGFTQERSYVQMRRHLTSSIPVAQLPGAIEIEPLSEDSDEDVRRAHNEIFYEMARLDPVGSDQWAADRQFLSREWSCIAVDKRGDRPRLAGYLLCAKFEQDWNASGWREGYIDEVALHEEWRSFDLVPAMMATSMNAILASGIEYAGIDVTIDPREEDPYARMGVYEKFGFERTLETYVMTRSLED